MSANSAVLNGLVFTFGSAISEILDFNHSGISRESIPVSTIDLAAPGAGKFSNDKFIPAGSSDPGEITITRHHNPDELPPIDGAAAAATIQYKATGGDTTGALWTFTELFCTNVEWSGEFNGKMTKTETYKVSGEVTVAAGS